MPYSDVPPYETAPRAQVRPSARYAYASRLVLQGVYVENAFRTIHEARRARENARRRGEWVSHLLERVGPREWVPASPRLRAMYAVPAPASEQA